MYSKRIFVVLLLGVWATWVGAQQFRELAYEHIHNLHGGTLIVCLPVSKAQLGYMNKRLAMPDIGDRERKVLEARIADTKAVNEKSRALLRKLFEEHYKFSALRFMDDSCLVAQDVEAFKQYSGADTEHIYLVQFERMSETGVVAHGLVVKDVRLKHLYSPFPFFTKTLFAEEIYDQSLGKAVRRLNKRFESFYVRSLRNKK